MKSTPLESASAYCPACGDAISDREVNLKEGVAQCSACGKLSRLSTLDYEQEDDDIDTNRLPKSIRIVPGADRVEIHVSLASWTKFLASLLICLFWNGIVSIFLSLAVAAVYYQIWGPCPDWFPTPGLEDGKPIMNDQVMGPGMTIFFCLFLTPFVTIGTGMIINTLMRLCGRTVIVIDPYRSHASTGLGMVKLSRAFDALKVRKVEIDESRWKNNNQVLHLIQLKMREGGGQPVRFGRMLSEEQLVWVTALLNRVIFRRGPVKYDDFLTEISWLGKMR